MAEERKLKGNPHDQDNKLPKDVLNAAQDPHSFEDPLQVQLEKSKDMNGPEEHRKLQDLKEKYGDTRQD
jgi:hypothetical protein